uniref:Uncharacterized protein n=1 Tax=Candidatus Kentrum sp. LPFa TaxID=2126335 RepID=A0A450W7M4_9GAMM|nr:MAG: hypothetical protein BECKLPF1236A_GA0070988_100814 [Candidatus Kentron sp. LPFa]VFK25929.1 MAG: hypothetical protein BECKLPF1236C_GA0070990_1002716 [Candidatus Kentron sp. LPFa]
MIAGDFMDIDGTNRILSPTPGGIGFEGLAEGRHLGPGAGDGGAFPGLEEADGDGRDYFRRVIHLAIGPEDPRQGAELFQGDGPAVLFQ